MRMEKIATREAYGKALVKLGEKNQDVVVLDADLSKSTKTADFAKAFPERFINNGYCRTEYDGNGSRTGRLGRFLRQFLCHVCHRPGF